MVSFPCQGCPAAQVGDFLPLTVTLMFVRNLCVHVLHISSSDGCPKELEKWPVHLPGQKNAFLLWCGSKQHKCANVTYCVFYVALSFKVIPWICVSAYTSIVKKRLRILLNLNAKRTANTHIPSPLVPLKQHYDRVKLGIEVAVTSFQGWWKREREFRWVQTIQGMLLIRGWCMSCPTLESALNLT